MRIFRWKQASLAKAAHRLVDKAQCTGRRLVIGMGSAHIAPTGKGESSVPTKKIIKAIMEAKKIKENVKNVGSATWRPISILNIDEFRTTMCCWKCHQPIDFLVVNKREKVKEDDDEEEKIVYKRRKSARLKHCPSYAITTDRDKQASRNILLLTLLKYYAKERPQEFNRQKKNEINVRKDVSSLDSAILNPDNCP